jgi:uncharacterized protein YyaL (SSP411 family)
LEERAAGALRAAAPFVRRAPEEHAQTLIALDLALGPSFEVVIAGRSEAEDTRAMLRALGEEFLPNAVVHLRPPGEASIAELVDYVAPLRPIDGSAAAYVCRGFSCRAPTTSVQDMLAALRQAGTVPASRGTEPGTDGR